MTILPAASVSACAPGGSTQVESYSSTISGPAPPVHEVERREWAEANLAALSDLLDWADEVRDLGVRANADTPAEARMARDFRVDGLGLCRTEHMFFDAARITVMREMILADTDAVVLEQQAPDRLAEPAGGLDIGRGGSPAAG